MIFVYYCPHCGQKLKVDDSMENTTASCPVCRKKITPKNFSSGEKKTSFIYYCPGCRQKMEVPNEMENTFYPCPCCKVNCLLKKAPPPHVNPAPTQPSVKNGSVWALDGDEVKALLFFVVLSGLVLGLIIWGVVSCANSESVVDYASDYSYSSSYYDQWEMLEQMAQLFIQTATINAGLELGVSSEEAWDVAKTFKRDVRRSYISGDSALIIGTFTVKNQTVGYRGKYKKDKSGIWMPVPEEQRIFIPNSLDF